MLTTLLTELHMYMMGGVIGVVAAIWTLLHPTNAPGHE